MRRTSITAAALAAAALAISAAPALAAPTAPSDDQNDLSSRPDAQIVQPGFTDDQIRVMATSSGRTIEEQTQRLDQQSDQNNAYADLVADGFEYDGAFFTDDAHLVLQADNGSAAWSAARNAGIEVRDAEFGQSALDFYAQDLSGAASDWTGIASIVPDIATDQIVITVTSDDADPELLAEADALGDAVRIEEGTANAVQTDIKGGDEITVGSGGYCSAGFPAKKADGTKVMVWVGHCVEDQSTFSVDGQQVGTYGDGAFISYDGEEDRDIGYVEIDEDDSITSMVNTYDSSTLPTDATQGSWKAPVGTDTCKSGATSGVTCGPITGYNATVTYSDQYGQTQAVVTGLGEADICTAAGDSGGAYTSQGHAVGMTSGGPGGQDCGFNGGYVEGSSYFQPVTDALDYFDLTYGV